MATHFDTAQLPTQSPVFTERLRIYTGILGQIGDIIAFTPTLRRIKELYPNSRITFAVSARYREAGELVEGLPYVDRLFVTELYFERLTEERYFPWHLGWPVDLRGDDEVAEQRQHDIVLETRPRHRRMPWWEFGHMTEEMAHMVGVPGPIEHRTEIRIPPEVTVPPLSAGKIVLHNDPAVSSDKQWPWLYVERFVQAVGPEQIVLIGHPGPGITGALDLRGKTTLKQVAALLAQARCFIGVDSGPMWMAASLQAPTVGLFGTSHFPMYEAIYPVNPRAVYLQAEGALDGISPNMVLGACQRVMAQSETARR